MEYVHRNACCTWDFTLKAEGVDLARLKGVLKTHCKKWCFQKEMGESGYVHYQGRMSLKLKDRLVGTRAIFVAEEMPEVHLTPTSEENRDNHFYVTKIGGRLDGPWMDTDVEVPPDVAIATLYQWQQDVLDSVGTDNDRHINIIADEGGNIGKSFLMRYAGSKQAARMIPASIEKAADIMEWCMSWPESRLYIVDLPRAANQSELSKMYSALEMLKNGYMYDHRYRGREVYMMHRPTIWVFCNKKPNESWLTRDRWKFWRVVDRRLLPATA